MDIFNALISIATPIATYVNECAFKPLMNYNTNFNELEQQTLKLEDAIDRLQHSVDDVVRKGHNIQNDVLRWLEDANAISEEARKFLQDFGGEWNCLSNLCSNLFKRHQLSKKAKRITGKILEIHGRSNFDPVSYPPTFSMDWSSSIPDYATFESRESIMKKILDALKDPHNFKPIGVYGMGGVGKTTLVDEISRRVQNMGLFDKVVKVTISQTPNLENIQRQLCDMLDLRSDQETTVGRAHFLRTKLLEEKILFVLDDMWKKLELDKLGIPSKGDCKGCKIIITSRDYHVLFNEMNTDKNFEIKVLSEEESWEIFENITGKDVETNRELNAIAVEVVKECGRLPLALVVVAKALKGKHLHTWRVALKQLKDPTMSVNIEGVSKEVYSSLALSYEFLDSKEARLLFLLCSMFPEDYEIEIDKYLVCYALGLGFLGINTLGDARDMVFDLVDKLKSCCLLLKSEKGDEYVKMHDVIRDFAIGIASKDDKIYTLSYGQAGLNEWKDESVEENYTAIWVDCRSILQHLPKKLRFPKLELLALRGDTQERPYIFPKLEPLYKPDERENIHIPETLFEGTENLKVLWAEGMYLFPWPSSFSHLIHLKTLSLIQCQLGNTDIFCELKGLEILNLCGSDIKELPKGMDQLVRLKLLDISFCKELRVIPANVISRMEKLEVLQTIDGFSGWEKEDLSYCEGKNASISELNHLTSLTTLSLSVSNVDILPERAFSRYFGLKSFEINFGFGFERVEYTTSRVLDIKMDSIKILLDDGLNKLLKECEELNLEASQNGRDVLSELDRSGSPHLKHLRLKNNSDIVYLVSEIDEFSVLESLKLVGMEGLEIIIHGGLEPVQVFNKLKTIKVYWCNKLRSLFPLSVMECLSNLEEIEVYRCDQMETIFVVESEEEEAKNKMECRQLRRLDLYELPQLTSICSKLRHLQIAEESHLFNEEVAFPNLEKLRISSLSKLRMIWHPNQVFANEFCKLRDIQISNCDNLRSVITSNVMEKLTELQSLDVTFCNSVEEVFEIKTSDAIRKEEGSFAKTCKLKTLYLSSLPKLKKVWSNDPRGVFKFQCLESVNVEFCERLKSILPTSITEDLQQLKSLDINCRGIQEIFDKKEISETTQKVSFPHLEIIYIVNVDNLEFIWHNQLIVDDLSQLQKVYLYGCKSLKSVFPSHAFKSTIFMKLKSLDIISCDSLEEVFGVDKEEDGEIISMKLDVQRIHNFENLEDVKVSGCPKLKRFVPKSQLRHFQKQIHSLEVDDCGLDVIFANQETSQTEFLLTKDGFPNLTKLHLKSKNVIGELWHSKFSRELFPRLKILEFNGGLDGNEDELNHFSLASNQLLYNLEELEVSNASVIEIFSDDGLITTEKKQMRRSHGLLKRLRLIKLSKLMHIWKGSSQPLFDNLEFLHVEMCNSLKILVSSSSFSFQNLTNLEISECHGLINLLNSGVAKSLVKLQRMTLHKCESLTSVLTEEDQENEENEEEIVFSKLAALGLYELPKLKKFQDAKCSLKFPSLERFEIEECPEMKIFSPGVVGTPLLRGVTLIRQISYSRQEKTIWAGNMNDTFPLLWKDYWIMP